MNPYGGGYPQPGYPQQGGYPGQQPGYPQPAGVSMPEPYGGAGGQSQYPQAGGLPYPAQPPQIGFGGGAPPPAGYPGAPPPAAYPGAPPAAAYPGAPPPAGYPGAPQSQGYNAPPAQPGYPAPGGYQQPPAGGYQPPGGYAPPPQPGYQQPPGGYQQPPAGGYQQPPQGGYAPPPQQQGYGAPPPPSQGAMYNQPSQGYAPAPQQGAYAPPPQQSSYAAQPPQAGAPKSHPPAGAVPTAAMAGMNISAKQPRTEGTVKAQAGFSAERDCEVLRKAMKGMGTDEKAIIDVLARRSNQQRQEIKILFKTMYGKDLIKELKSELGGKFENAVVALMDKPDEFDAKECRRAIEGLGTDEDTLIEILCSRSNKEIHELKATYKRLFKKDLEKDLSGDLSGYFRRLMISLCTAGRQEDMALDPEKAKRHAQELYSAGAKRLGTDESKFNQILCSQSYPQLQLTFDEYQKLSGKSLEQAIASEMSGDLESGMKAVVKCVKNRQAYFAEKVYKSMKGAGTNDRALVRIVVSRCEVDMVQIKQHFQQKYGKTVESFIEGDTSGDYKRILLALVRPM